VVVLLAAVVALGATSPQNRPGVAAGEDTFVAAPEYLPLFAPRPHQADYRIAVSPLGIEEVLRSLEDDESLVREVGAWRPRREPAQDAFGRSGDYNLWALNRVYGAMQPRVARGPRLQDGRIAESWILVSPYPDPSLRRLVPGTLRIIIFLNR
jgi:hypothetical protein